MEFYFLIDQNIIKLNKWAIRNKREIIYGLDSVWVKNVAREDLWH